MGYGPGQTNAERPAPAVAGGWRRSLYAVLGGVFVGLAILGALLPLLPTTPFLLLASYFFLRSAPGLNDRLLRSRWFGPMLRTWQEHRAVSRRVKVTALTMMPVAVASSAAFGNLPWPLLVLLGLLAAVGMWVVIRLPVAPPKY